MIINLSNEKRKKFFEEVFNIKLKEIDLQTPVEKLPNEYLPFISNLFGAILFAFKDNPQIVAIITAIFLSLSNKGTFNNEPQVLLKELLKKLEMQDEENDNYLIDFMLNFAKIVKEIYGLMDVESVLEKDIKLAKKLQDVKLMILGIMAGYNVEETKLKIEKFSTSLIEEMKNNN